MGRVRGPRGPGGISLFQGPGGWFRCLDWIRIHPRPPCTGPIKRIEIDFKTISFQNESKSRWLRNQILNPKVDGFEIQGHEIISNSMASKSWPFHGFDFENLGRGRKSTCGFRIRFLNRFEI